MITAVLQSWLCGPWRDMENSEFCVLLRSPLKSILDIHSGEGPRREDRPAVHSLASLTSCLLAPLCSGLTLLGG